jgi:ribosome-associated protein
MNSASKFHSLPIITAADVMQEVVFTTSRSSGPGGQNVNKVNTKVTLRFDIDQSQALTADHKSLLKEKLKVKVTTEGVLVLSSQDRRSQIENKEAVISKFEKLLKKAFEKPKPRKKTKPSKAKREERINAKKKQGEKKKWRQKL